MSPFDLRGPEFLQFYLFLGAMVLLALYLSRRFSEPMGPVRADLSDPYMIAYLRGGQNELLRIMTISLIHRGLLKVSGSTVSVASPKAADGVRDSLERDLLLYFETPGEAASVFSESHFSSTFDHYKESLETLGLLPNPWVRKHRLLVLIAGLILLWGVAVVKIGVALARGRTNIIFLIILAIVFGVLARKVVLRRLTLRGKAMLDDLSVLFGGLKDRAANSFTPNDVALLAAVFGIAALPLAAFPYVETLYPKAMATSRRWGSGSSSDSCGAVTSCGSSSSCGSSGGDGGGGGCGGGGCGGGCGGCGS